MRDLIEALLFGLFLIAALSLVGALASPPEKCMKAKDQHNRDVLICNYTGDTT